QGFLQAHGITRDTFLIEDPRDPVRELVALEPAVGDGVRVTFSLPTAESSPDFRWHPKVGSVSVLVAGVQAPVAAVDSTERTIILGTPPALGAAIVASYRGLRLVRVSDPPTLHGVTRRFGRYELALVEILRG
ncbi:MAG: hypothetical protein R3F05_10925, partial [Planctomycetota bacterium]